jgi:hypothetical protein
MRAINDAKIDAAAIAVDTYAIQWKTRPNPDLAAQNDKSANAKQIRPTFKADLSKSFAC